MKTNTIQTAATAVIVLTLVLGMLGTSPSTPNGASHFLTGVAETDFKRVNSTDGYWGLDTRWSAILKPPVRIAD